MANLQALEQRLVRNEATYQVHFAGRSRLTRDVARMEALLEGAQGVLAELAGQRGGDAAQREAIAAKAQHQTTLYGTEREAIAQAQREAGAKGRQAAFVAQRARFAVHIYTRHFAGQSRTTRDVSLLGDLLAWLEPLAADLERLGAASLPSAQEDLRWVQSHITQFHSERHAIAQALSDLLLAEQVSALAQVANGLFAAYRTHFAGQPRVTRRPELLVRLIQAAEQTGDRMQALRLQGLHDSDNDANIDVVAQRVAAWQTELSAVRLERQRTGLAALWADLEIAANAELESYAEHFGGQDRRSRDLARLCALCDRLGEVERQMTRLVEVQDLPSHDARIASVRDSLALYQDEYDAILAAQRVAAD